MTDGTDAGVGSPTPTPMDAPAPMDAAPPVDTAAAAVTSPDFGEIQNEVQPGDPASLSMLYDLSLPVTIELGRARMSVEEVLALGRGSVIQLDRLAGEPIDVLVGDRRFAEGEVVVIGEQFGVRITRITSPNPATAAAGR